MVDLGGEGFSVAFDPLDGSSIVDTNFTVGTIFGVWPGDKLTGITGRDQAAAGMGIYGPRTIYCIALKDAPGCHEFLLMVRSQAFGDSTSTTYSPYPLLFVGSSNSLIAGHLLLLPYIYVDVVCMDWYQLQERRYISWLITWQMCSLCKSFDMHRTDDF